MANNRNRLYFLFLLFVIAMIIRLRQSRFVCCCCCWICCFAVFFCFILFHFVCQWQKGSLMLLLLECCCCCTNKTTNEKTTTTNKYFMNKQPLILLFNLMNFVQRIKYRKIISWNDFYCMKFPEKSFFAFVFVTVWISLPQYLWSLLPVLHKHTWLKIIIKMMMVAATKNSDDDFWSFFWMSFLWFDLINWFIDFVCN